MLISLLTEKNEHEQFKFFKKFKAIYEKQHETKIKELRSDNGLEYFSSEFQEFLRREGIFHKTSVAYVPQSNGKAERLNRTLLEKARTMMATTNLPFYMWGSAILAANYLRNRTPCKSINFNRHLRIFGCTAYPLIMTKRNKFEPTAQANCILAGFDDSDGIYWIYNRTTRKMFRSRDVKFNESFTNVPDKPNNTRDGE